jgi:hypothetical protein
VDGSVKPKFDGAQGGQIAMNNHHAVEAVHRLAAEYQDVPRTAPLVIQGLEHIRRWFAGDPSENNAARGLAALAAAFERCAAAGDFDLGIAPGAAQQVERLAEKLEQLGWRRGQLPGLAAVLKPGERIKCLTFGTVQIAQPNGRVRVIYCNEVKG